MQVSVLLLYYDRSLSEAAARRFGNYELWVLNAAMIRTMLVERQDARGTFPDNQQLLMIATNLQYVLRPDLHFAGARGAQTKSGFPPTTYRASLSERTPLYNLPARCPHD